MTLARALGPGFFAALAALWLGGCGGEPEYEPDSRGQRSSAIIMGVASTAETTYSTVGVTTSPTAAAMNDGAYCSGTLIAPNLVVTAAHCVVEEQNGTIVSESVAKDVAVIAGPLDSRKITESQKILVRKIVRHPGYPNLDFPADREGLAQNHDIALLLLAKNVTDLPAAPVLPLALVNATLHKGTPVTLSGYGTRNTAETLFGQLYDAQTPYERRNDNEFIAGTLGMPDTCPGDSGGPTYVPVNGKHMVFGVTSRSTATASLPCGEGGIYTLLPAYYEWIRDNSEGSFPPVEVQQGCSCTIGRAEARQTPGTGLAALAGLAGLGLLASRRHRSARRSSKI